MSVATTNKAARNGRQAKGSLKPGTNGKKPRIPKTDYLDPAQLLNVLDAVRRGDFSLRLPASATGETGAIYEAFNEIIERNERLTAELNRISDVVGREGRISDRAAVEGASGGWASCVDSVNALITDLAQPTTEVARVIGAVAEGDLSQNFKLEIEGRPLKGEFLRTGKTVNRMVTQLGAFASEVTRVAREVGTEGKLGGQAQVKGVSGTWKDLTENVNLMANNLTGQVRNIAEVTTAVATGDLSKKITVDVKGEILELKNTINTMVD
ncbi:MAG TPA: HAMP domain-containing protein, partial [Pyrinomonadaceae bacterium]|nr:HAMP domain-containing protein [Pyrinomonadaceae bacterium]